MSHWTSALALVLLGACTPYSPPVRSPLPGAPGELGVGQVEAGGAATIHATGGPTMAIGMTDWLAVEGGGEGYSGREGWALGYAGTRLSLNGRKRRKRVLGNGPAADLGIGFGAGAIGFGSKEGLKPAGGGYADIGVGYHLARQIALFIRGGAQYTGARAHPATWWWHVGAGPQVTLGPVSFYAAGGAAGFTNAAGDEHSYTVDFGAALRFDAFGSPRDRD